MNILKFLGAICISAPLMAQRPSVDYFNPASSAPGSIVTLVGSGFNSLKDQNRVMFGAAVAHVLTATPTLLEVRVPVGATYAPPSVNNLASNLTAYAGFPFLSSFSGGQLIPADFELPLNLNSESELYDLCMCDFDLDGKTDIATANRNSSFINIYHNQSQPALLQFAASTQNLNSRTINVTCGDVNGDGRPDLLLSRSGTPGDRIFILLNTSSGGNISFAAPQYYLVDGIIARRIFLGDLDRDGRPEIMVTNQDNNRITVFRNNSVNRILQLEMLPSIVIEDPVLLGDRTTAGISVADLNGDGYPEIIASGFTQPNIFVVPNLSSGGIIRFGPVQEFRMNGNLINLATGDLNGDGIIDIIATKMLQNKVGILINRTDLNSANSAMNLAFHDEVEITVNDKPWGLDLGDLNGDGKVDVVVASIESGIKQLAILENTSSNGQYSYFRHLVTLPEVSRNVRIGDLDGDGKPDIAVTSIQTSKVSVLRNAHCVEPFLQNNGPILACAGETITLQATPAPSVTFEWFKSDGSTTSSVTGNSIFRDNPDEGIYQYWLEATGEGGNCVYTSPAVTVSVSASAGIVPAPVISDPGTSCAGSNQLIILEPSSIDNDADYSWILPDGSRSTGTELTLNSIDVRSSGRYIVNASKGSCLGVADTLLLEVLSPPRLEVTGSNPLNFCQGYSVTLNTLTDPLFSYQWWLDGQPIAGAQSSSYEATTSGDYHLQGIYQGACSVLSPVLTLTALAPPVAGFNLPASGACAGQPLTFENTSVVASGAPVMYRWLNGASGLSTEFSPVYTYATAGIYNVELRVSYPDERCASVLSQPLTVSASPTVNIVTEGVADICSGQSLLLQAGASYTSYLWSNGATTASITVDQPGIYRLTATNSSGCPGTAEQEVRLFEPPVITVIPSEASIEAGQSVLLQSGGAANYLWTPVETLDDPTSANPIATPITSTEYTVTGTDANGCSGTASVMITVGDSGPALVTNALLSPNGDGENDFWIIENIESFPDYTVSVFNRTGLLLFSASPYYNDWNGTYRGQELANDVYYYVISQGGAKIKTGTITLLR